MKKFVVLWWAGLLFCAGCSEESVVYESAKETSVNVRFTLALRQDITPFRQTRNMPDEIPGELLPRATYRVKRRVKKRQHRLSRFLRYRISNMRFMIMTRKS